jgi:uncharacterized protein
MRTLIVSDIHGRLFRAERLARIIDDYHPGKILFLGDYLYNGPRNGVPEDYDPLKVAEILRRFKEMAVGIRGNCDSRVDEVLLGFPLRDHAYLTLNGKRVDLFHGDDYSLKRLRKKPGDMLLSGHTHLFVLEKKDGFLCVNPGSISFPKNGNPPSFAVFEPSFIEIRRFDDLRVLARMEF